MEINIYYFLIIWLLTQVLCVSTRTSTPKLVQIIFRHGERTPTTTYKTDPHKQWPEGWGQLTNRGKKQMYDLGLVLREYYKDVLPEYYYPEDIYILSSYADRCIMSAQSLLAALFPPVKEQIWNPNLLWQPIPIRYLPRSLDNLIALKRKCPLYDAALKAAYKSDKIQNINEQYKDLYEYLSKHAGQEVKNISTVETLHGTFEIEQLLNLSLPEWTKKFSMATMRTLAAENLAIFSQTLLMKRLKGGPLLNEIISRMFKKTENKLKPNAKLVLYSAHDLTIVTLLRTLGFNELVKPDYGASLIFELHEVNGEHEVRILYGSNFGESPVHKELAACETPCFLKIFREKLDAVLPVDWESECIQN